MLRGHAKVSLQSKKSQGLALFQTTTAPLIPGLGSRVYCQSKSTIIGQQIPDNRLAHTGDWVLSWWPGCANRRLGVELVARVRKH